MRCLVVLVCVMVAMCRSDDEIVDTPSKIVPAADKQTEILNAHNNLRRNEGASNMKALKWNDVLAQIAEGWANNCDFAHGQPATPSSPFSETGQNLYAKSSYPSNGIVNYTAIIQKWFDEKISYTYDTKTCLDGKVCGHYTQVVWSSSTDVGCAHAKCGTLGHTGTPAWTNALLVVCNYGPAGNWVGEFPYKKGAPCGDCPDACTNGLCN